MTLLQEQGSNKQLFNLAKHCWWSTIVNDMDYKSCAMIPSYQASMVELRAGSYDVAVPQWLVHWDNMTEEEATWEDAHYMMATFPGFHP